MKSLMSSKERKKNILIKNIYFLPRIVTWTQKL